MTKWYTDLLAWFAILLVGFVLGFSGFYLGIQNVMTSCKNYGAYMMKEEILLCVVKPLIQENQGELNYLRPEGKKPLQVKEI
jgi:hypothetical protein